MYKPLLILSLLSAAVFTTANAAVNINRVVCHDPSIFMDTITTGTKASPRYYIYGSHLGNGSTTADKNYINWSKIASIITEADTTDNAFFVDSLGNKSNYRKVYGAAHDWQYTGNTVAGMQWAPDVIYNKKMKKWCMYMSLNGDYWCSSIVLFTSDDPRRGWKYVGPVVYSGFNGKYTHNGFAAASDYKNMDLEQVIGTQSSLPSRYNVGSSWGSYWPNCIDPCVFYDEEDKLWMSYGSWSGGIFMLQLNDSTGLRDYSVTYQSIRTNASDYRTATSDPYFGKKIAGGYYVSGEASYIEHIGKYYYLFMSYGGLCAVADNGTTGYQIRVFRSENPDGPYKDCNTTTGQSAIYSAYKLNFGSKATINCGVRLMSAYKWDTMTKGEIAQGHNSAITDHKGRALIVYHTREVNNGEGHSVRVHQLFQNQDGWLVAAPYEFYGETVTQADIDSTQQYGLSQVAGDYQLIVHKPNQDADAQEYAVPENISLNPDSTITGTYTGKWSLVKGTGHIMLYLKGILGYTGVTVFRGVVIEQTTSVSTQKKALCFTALSSSSGSTTLGTATRGVCIWGTQTAVASGIETVEMAETPSDRQFDLMGRPVSDSYKGLRIDAKGHKMIIR